MGAMSEMIERETRGEEEEEQWHKQCTKSKGLNTEVTYIWNAWPLNANNTLIIRIKVLFI